MNLRRIVLAVATASCLSAAAASAQTTFLVPSLWRPAQPMTIKVALRTRVDLGALQRNDVLRVTSLVVSDRRGKRVLSTAAMAEDGSIDVPIRVRGTTMIAAEITPFTDRMSGADFDAFLAYWNLTDAIQVRARSGHAGQPVEVKILRSAKAAVQIGDEVSPNFFAPFGQKLEIVSLSNPFLPTKNHLAPTPVRVLLDGKPTTAAREITTPLFGYNQFGPEGMGGGRPANGDHVYTAINNGDFGVLYRVVQLDPCADGVHYVLREAIYGLRFGDPDAPVTDPASKPGNR